MYEEKDVWNTYEKNDIKAINLLFETKEEEEERVLRRVLWCLNAGGRRRWTIKGRPDKINRNTPSPDYVCEEQKTKARLSIEITSASPIPEGRKFEVEKDRLVHASNLLTSAIKEKIKTRINGIYVSKSDLCSNPRHVEKLNNAASKFVEEYKNGRLSSFEKVIPIGELVFSSPKILEYYNGINNDPWNTPGLGTYIELKRQIRIAINEANKKLKNCVGEGVLVVSIDPILDLEEIDILESFKKKAKSHIKHFYAYGRTSAQIMKIW
jgi:hypothetical protein